MRSDRQPVATHGNGFGLFLGFLGSGRLPLVAPAWLHKGSMRIAQKRWLEPDPALPILAVEA
jgi:hypothetical protein